MARHPVDLDAALHAVAVAGRHLDQKIDGVPAHVSGDVHRHVVALVVAQDIDAAVAVQGAPHLEFERLERVVRRVEADLDAVLAGLAHEPRYISRQPSWPGLHAQLCPVAVQGNVTVEHDLLVGVLQRSGEHHVGSAPTMLIAVHAVRQAHLLAVPNSFELPSHRLFRCAQVLEIDIGTEGQFYWPRDE